MTPFQSLTAHDCALWLLNNKCDVCVAMHRSPDADALGSALALCEIIRMLGGNANVVSSDPIPERLLFLTEGEKILSSFTETGVRVAVDVASPQQLGSLCEYANSFSLMIDHHARGEAFAPNYTVKGAAACGELIYYIAKDLADAGKITMTEKLCGFIFAAVSDDTGSFRFGNTTPEVLRCAAELVEMGANTERISHLLFAVKTPSELRAEKLALIKMRFFCDGKVALSAASRLEMDAEDLKNEDFSEISDKMRSVSGVLVGVSIRECKTGEWRVSLRANVPVDCAEVASTFGGGGHVQAAGCSIYADSEEDALSLLIPELERAVVKYERTASN